MGEQDTGIWGHALQEFFLVFLNTIFHSAMGWFSDFTNMIKVQQSRILCLIRQHGYNLSFSPCVFFLFLFSHNLLSLTFFTACLYIDCVCVYFTSWYDSDVHRYVP